MPGLATGLECFVHVSADAQVIGFEKRNRLTAINPLAVVENRPLKSADASEVVSVDTLAETSNNSFESSCTELGPRLVYKA